MPRRPRKPPRPGALADLAPLRIITQIAILQIGYYVSAATLILFTALVMATPINLDLLFSWRSLRSDITVGWMLGLVWMLNSLICVIYLLLLIARSKLVPDFALTIHFIHLIATSLYTSAIPTYWFWWALQIASASLMVFLGMWICQYRELRPIQFGKSSRISPTAAMAAATEDDGVGHSRGRGRGKDRDGVEEYEMIDTPEVSSQA
ncbi:hypothetical protein EJ05DRAFT_507947 [Pseudovirgaria hyperparasitica]|uniref:Integral membrane protein n=1 Tax=Pseudovirgaria hyperparasitica TaxID=470096 RepID=A0A6A6WCX8_9PEZI|nr:uncharacterized protein EJ05DRAFT_507947 [Pseudovirgaria hyperparasitica]KAF2760688.1 hypothetical protein EJ05DRAFT_507947 [Pseudovirgaria hyperparasitica]